MIPGIIYRGEFVNIETTRPLNDNIQQVCRLDILDTETLIPDGDDPAVFDLDMADEPVRVSVIDNAEDPFTPIRAKQLDANIYTTSIIEISTFAGGGDNRYKVNYYVNDILKFTGYLSTSDLSQQFMPDPNILHLIAGDGLGLLNDVALVDFNGDNPRLENQVMDYIAWALNGNGLQLPIVCCFNIREEFATPLISDDSGDGHFFKWIWLRAKTFEDNINTSINCYETLLRIIGEEATIFQDNGTWFIFRKDEYIIDRLYYLFTFDYLGTFVSSTTAQFTKSVGVNLPLSWMNDDEEVSLVNPVKRIEENFALENPIEILENADLSRGTDLTPTTINPDDWSLEQSGSPNYLPIAEGVGSVVTVDVDGYEKERFLRMEVAATSQFLFWRNEIKIPIQAGDKFRFQTDWRLDADPGGSGHYARQIARLALFGDDGSTWTLHARAGYDSSDPQTKWMLSINETLTQEGLAEQDDLSEWQTASCESTPAPVTGRLQIMLVHNTSTNVTGKDFAAISFEYIPYVLGTYGKYKGQQHNVEQVLSTKAKRTNDVFISDTLKQIWKGCLLKTNGNNVLYSSAGIGFSAPNIIALPLASGYQKYLFTPGAKLIIDAVANQGIFTIDTIVYHTIGNYTEITVKEQTITSVTQSAVLSEQLYIQANSFYNAQVFPNADYPDPTYLHPYGEIQAFDVWNQFRRLMRKFDGDVDGLESNTELPDLKYKYFLTDASQNTNNKMFMLIHFDQDQHTCEWNAFFYEVQDTTIINDYSGHEFKYLADKS